MTFSVNPEIQRLKGDITERFSQLQNAHWDGNTNLLASFTKLLEVAKQHNLSKEDMPNKILIISDMEFDQAASSGTNYHAIKDMYEQSGYAMPYIVFWNVNGRLGNVPAQKNEFVGLVS